jgi:resuscitation-promoting factor RpfA
VRELLATYTYRGRHRAEIEHHHVRDAAIVGALVLTAAPVLTAPAAAAPPGGWDPVLDCETDWRNVESYNESSASGYFQIIDSTWREMGGLRFAPRAIQATRAEQEQVANRLYDRRGLKPWNASRHCWGGRTGTEPAKAAPKAAAPATAPAKAAPKAGKGTAIPDGYRVRRGDTLSAIARRFDVPGGYREVARVNHIVNPHRIDVGQRLR